MHYYELEIPRNTHCDKFYSFVCLSLLYMVPWIISYCAWKHR